MVKKLAKSRISFIKAITSFVYAFCNNLQRNTTLTSELQTQVNLASSPKNVK